LSGGKFAEHIFLHPATINWVGAVDLHSWIDDGNEVNSFLQQVSRESFQIWEACLVDSEDAIPIHIVDIEVNCADWEFVAIEMGRYFADFCFSFISPAGLVISERPERWEWWLPRQITEAIENLSWRSWNEIITEHAALEVRFCILVERYESIERVFIKNQVAALTMEAQVHWSTKVEWVVAGFIAATWILVP